jgi:hypothetical protein
MSKFTIECEIRAGEGWSRIGVAEALDRRSEDMRCTTCHGQVIPHGGDGAGALPYFAHEKAFEGCNPNASEESRMHPDSFS